MLQRILDEVYNSIASPREGLPEEVFIFISKVTPLINVDLLIKDNQGRTLLTWRHDRFYGPGWHVPGGIIRYKERIVDRIRKVAQTELGSEVEFDSEPICINEIFAQSQERGHFISLLFRCRLLSGPDEKLRYLGTGIPKNGMWMWHEQCPDNLIKVHEIYRKYIDR